MAAVVFVRGVNVGGHKAFRPATFAKELSALEVVNIGAAGTFIVRKNVAQATLRAEFLRRLPVKAEFMICPARDLVELMSADTFPREDSVKGTRRFVSVLARRPSTTPRFPLSHPAGKAWQVKLVGLRGRFVLSLWRRMGATMVYPNEVVEKELAIPATTRNWDTISKIHEILRSS
jgi:uncharacterized protein (DUF1697 family)